MQSEQEVQHDVRLLDRIVARDADALGELYDCHCGLLHGLVLRMLGDRSDAEEVLQEVFVQVWSRAETYDARLGSPIAWLVRIARNRAIDRLRANTVRTRSLVAPPLRPVESPETRAATTEEQRLLVRALDSLSLDDRRLLEHAYYLGLTQSELAERFSLPLGTVKTRIRAALSVLRRELRQTIGQTSGYDHV
jgi:RNA polymerase sigma-70 factor (ECF subfamily)